MLATPKYFYPHPTLVSAHMHTYKDHPTLVSQHIKNNWARLFLTRGVTDLRVIVFGVQGCGFAVHSFVRSFVRSFLAFVCCSFFCFSCPLFVHSMFARVFVYCSPVLSCVHSFIRSFVVSLSVSFRVALRSPHLLSPHFLPFPSFPYPFPSN